MTPLAELALVLGCAAVLGIVARFFRQPLILAYLVAGALIGAFGFLHLDAGTIFGTFSDIGIMFLLFLVGLEINYSSLRLVGKASLIVGAGQMTLSFLLGFLISHVLALPFRESFYVALAVTFSSTIIVVELLSEKHALQSLHGKLSVGVLLVQDFVAVVVLFVLSGFFRGEALPLGNLIGTVVGGVVFMFGVLFLARHLFPLLFERFARTRGLVFLTSIAWLFLVAALMEYIGFSVEIGGLVAGLALANSAERFEIASRMRPLRDFFIVLFFVVLGSSLFAVRGVNFLIPVVVLSLFVLVGKSFIVFVLMRLLRYTHRTSFMTGIAMAQVSEFGFIIAAAGVRAGFVGNETLALITAIGMVTITVSTYCITRGDVLYRALRPCIRFFDLRRANGEPLLTDETVAPRVLLAGGHRTGQAFLKRLRRKEGIVVVDFDPEVAQDLEGAGYRVVLGDIGNIDLLERFDFTHTKLVVSTIPSFDDNETLVGFLARRHTGKNPRIVVRAEHDAEARLLKQQGADDVFIPEAVSGTHLAAVLAPRRGGAHPKGR